MPRDYEIKDAFRLAIKCDARGRYTVSTLEFVKEPQQLNWHFTAIEVNRWIEVHKSDFRDISASEGEERTFQVFNPNGVMWCLRWWMSTRSMQAARQYSGLTCAAILCWF